jgi:type IV pilus assembly protein PilV
MTIGLKREQIGFSMIEVLITMVLICIGVLGMMALQGRTIQYTQDAVQRNVAAGLAIELVEMMRARPEGLPGTSGFLKGKDAEFPSKPDKCTPLPDETEDQLGCWAAKAAQVLPGDSELMKSEYHVCRSKTRGNCTNDGDAIEIRIAWRVRAGECEVQGGDATVCSYTLRTQL